MDEYGLRHLTHHLYEAEQWEDLFLLVQNPVWSRKSHEADPRGLLYSADIEITTKAAIALGIEGLPPLIATVLRTGQAISSALPGIPAKGLACLIMTDQNLTDSVMAHILKSRVGINRAEACIAAASALSALGNNEKANVLARAAFSAISATSISAAESEILANTGSILVRMGDLISAREVLEKLIATYDFQTQFWKSHTDTGIGLLVLDLMGQLGYQECVRSSLIPILEYLESNEVPRPFRGEESCLYWRNRLRTCVALCHADQQDLAREKIVAVVRLLLDKRPRWLYDKQDLECLAEAMMALTIVGERQRAREIESVLLPLTQSFIGNQGNSLTDRISVQYSMLIPLAYAKRTSAFEVLSAETTNPALQMLSMDTLERMGLGEFWRHGKQVVSVGLRDLRQTLGSLFAAGVYTPLSSHGQTWMFSPLNPEGNYRLLALAGLGKALAQSGAGEDATELFLDLFAEVGGAIRTHKVPEVGYPALRRGFTSYYYAELLQAMVRSGDAELINIAIALAAGRSLKSKLKGNLSVRSFEMKSGQRFQIDQLMGYWSGPRFISFVVTELFKHQEANKAIEVLQAFPEIQLRCAEVWIRELATKEYLTELPWFPLRGGTGWG